MKRNWVEGATERIDELVENIANWKTKRDDEFRTRDKLRDDRLELIKQGQTASTDYALTCIKLCDSVERIEKLKKSIAWAQDEIERTATSASDLKLFRDLGPAEPPQELLEPKRKKAKGEDEDEEEDHDEPEDPDQLRLVGGIEHAEAAGPVPTGPLKLPGAAAQADGVDEHLKAAIADLQLPPAIAKKLTAAGFSTIGELAKFLDGEGDLEDKDLTGPQAAAVRKKVGSFRSVHRKAMAAASE